MNLAKPPASAAQPVNFRDPPVTEVVLAIQFEKKVVDLEVLAEFTARVKVDYPERTQHEPLAPMKEDFSAPPTGPVFSIDLAGSFSMPRTWFVSADKARVLQVQEDRFVLNWRRENPDAPYPRYEQLREFFVKHLSQLVQSIEAAGKEVPGTNFCEVTYVNQIEVDPAADGTELGQILAPIATPSYDFLPVPEDQQYGARFQITHGGERRGRLYVNSAPAIGPDERTMYVLNLTSRLVPADAGSDAAWEALELGHRWIVKGFVDLTTKQMHDKWGHEEEKDDD